MRPEMVRAFAPATVSNIGCGFDVFGFAVAGLGDVVEARRRSEPGVELVEVTGDGGALPRRAERNTAGVAALCLLERAGVDPVTGVELRLHKGMPLASGLGSSAASAVAAAVAVDALLELGLSRRDLLRAALEAERAGCGAAHGDNAAPSLYGGWVMVRGAGDELRVDELPVPEGLFCALVRPHVPVHTGAARALLGEQVSLAAAVRQWGNTAALVAGLFRGDDELLASAITDAVAEPLRSSQVPGFDAMRSAALEAGALGFGLSGSGPTVFALCRGRELAERAAAAMDEARAATGVGGDRLVSVVGAPGARLLAPGETP